MDDLDRDAIAFQWTMTLMKRAFTDLAVAFGAVDPALADKAVQRCEMLVAAEFDRMLKKPPEGITIEHLRLAIAEAAGPFRAMTQEARALIQQAGKPKN